jgi:hypothetical protein
MCKCWKQKFWNKLVISELLKITKRQLIWRPKPGGLMHQIPFGIGHIFTYTLTFPSGTLCRILRSTDSATTLI